MATHSGPKMIFRATPGIYRNPCNPWKSIDLSWGEGYSRDLRRQPTSNPAANRRRTRTLSKMVSDALDHTLYSHCVHTHYVHCSSTSRQTNPGAFSEAQPSPSAALGGHGQPLRHLRAEPRARPRSAASDREAPNILTNPVALSSHRQRGTEYVNKSGRIVVSQTERRRICWRFRCKADAR